MDLSFLAANEYCLKKVFVSKRNPVWLLEKDGRLLVYKKYEVGSLVREQNFLERLYKSQVSVPQVLEAGSDYLLLSYIEGITVCDFLQKAEKDGGNGQEIIEPLLQWLMQYYACTHESRGDVNLRNFIWQAQSQTIYGVDFEDEIKCDKFDDLGQILAYAISYNPVFSEWKKQWVKKAFQFFVQQGGFSQTQLEKAYIQALQALEKRRGVRVPKSVFEFLSV